MSSLRDWLAQAGDRSLLRARQELMPRLVKRDDHRSGELDLERFTRDLVDFSLVVGMTCLVLLDLYDVGKSHASLFSWEKPGRDMATI